LISKDFGTAYFARRIVQRQKSDFQFISVIFEI